MAFQLSGSGTNIVVSAATLQALTINQYYWIDRQGNVVSVGGNSLTAAAVPKPTDQAVFDVGLNQEVNLYIKHAALTGAVGGSLAIAELWPDIPGGDVGTNEIRVVQAPVTQVLAATAESLVKLVFNAYSAQRQIKIALAILFTTAPTGATPLTLGLWGFSDARMRAR